MATPESKAQKKMTDHLKADGYFVVKLMATNKNGIPDLLAVKEDVPNIWVEAKTEVGKLSKLQEHRIQELIEHGQSIIIPYGYEDFVFQYLKYKRFHGINQ